MRTDLLLALADRLEKRPKLDLPVKFDMSSWCDTDWRYEDDNTVHICGTSVCALGDAALMPEFQAAGLVWREFDREAGYGEELLDAKALNDNLRLTDHSRPRLCIRGEDPAEVYKAETTIAAQILDISADHAKYLFAQDTSASTLEMADKLRAYAETGETDDVPEEGCEE